MENVFFVLPSKFAEEIRRTINSYKQLVNKQATAGKTYKIYFRPL